MHIASSSLRQLVSSPTDRATLEELISKCILSVLSTENRKPKFREWGLAGIQLKRIERVPYRAVNRMTAFNIGQRIPKLAYRVVHVLLKQHGLPQAHHSVSINGVWYAYTIRFSIQDSTNTLTFNATVEERYE